MRMQKMFPRFHVCSKTVKKQSFWRVGKSDRWWTGLGHWTTASENQSREMHVETANYNVLSVRWTFKQD
jgi:hypothetical protein